MSITQEEIWKRAEILHQELYHSGKNYVASIYNKNGTVCVLKVLPKDKNEVKIHNFAAIMSVLMSEDKEPLYCCKGGFTCSLVHWEDDKYIFMAKRDILPEEIICKKYNIDPTSENKEKIKLAIQQRVYSYNHRDSEKKKRCITFEDAVKLDDYHLNTTYFDIYNEDEELQKLRHLAGKKVSELTPEQKTEVSNYITITLRPVLLYKAPNDSKLLVTEIPEFKTISYMDLCDTLINNTTNCSYCKCKMSLLNISYAENAVTFDAIISLYGHRKDNITLCCSLCNSKKTFKNKLDI